MTSFPQWIVHTLTHLQLKIQSKIGLEAAAYASEDPRQKVQQLLAVKDAYRRLRPVTTFLPSQQSDFPALLAARSLQQNVQGTKDAIASTQDRVTQAETTLHREEANLRDANLLTQAMENRIERLRAQREDRSQKTPAQLARELIAAKRTQKDKCDAEMQRLGEALNDFINDYLAAMIAAEELGGPVEVTCSTLKTTLSQPASRRRGVQSHPRNLSLRRRDSAELTRFGATRLLLMMKERNRQRKLKPLMLRCAS
jgi:hypothetical protein